MAINRRGAVLLVVTSVGFAASLLLIWPRRAHAPATAPVAMSRAVAKRVEPSSKEHVALCEDLARRYRALVADAAIGCARDDDCAAEERGGVYVGLDGCGRFTSKAMSHAAADQIEAEWLAAACATSGDVTADCGAVRAQCVAGRCVERPPEPLPRDWKRLSLPATLSVFAPADFAPRDVRGDDSLVRVFDGERRTLELSLDRYASPSVDPALHPRLEVIDGERARVYFVDRGADGGPRRYEAAAIFERHFSEFFLAGGYLSMRLYCADARACADRDAIFRSARVLAQPVEIQRDR